jgi:hypothetical protein
MPVYHASPSLWNGGDYDMFTGSRNVTLIAEKTGKSTADSHITPVKNLGKILGKQCKYGKGAKLVDCPHKGYHFLS